MRVIDIINNNTSPIFSFELLPPLKGTGIEKVYATIDMLREFDPKYINITTHRSEYVYQDLGNGLFKRNKWRRRPGTVAVAAAIQNKYNITVVPHILCSGFTREETEYVLLDLQFLGITSLLLLRGDKAKEDRFFTPTPGGHEHTTDLIRQVVRFNEGFFADGEPRHRAYITHSNPNEGIAETGFQAGKHELFPYPFSETSINENIRQNPGWDK